METKLLKIKGTEEFAVIDTEDYERVKSFNWNLVHSKCGKFSYIRRRISELGKKKCIRLSHVILGCADSGKRVYVKYLNKNTFDLRKSNLRILGTGDKIRILGAGDKKGVKKVTESASPTFRTHFEKGRLSPWSVTIYLPKTKNEIRIGRYLSEQNAKNVVRYIEENNIPISDEKEISLSKPIIRAWAVENGYVGFTDRYKYKIGDERIEHGRIYIKTEKGWRLKHYVVWEEAGNVIPENRRLSFKDGDKRNFDLENLEVFSAGERTRRSFLRKYPEELRPTIELLWELKHAIKDEKNKRSKNNSTIKEKKLCQATLQ